MDANINPLKNIPNLQVRHLIMQILAWMWVSVCSMYIGSIVFWGINAIAHTLLLAAIVITVGTFETAKRNPKAFTRIDGYNGRQKNGEHN
jgi:ABC-type multidrug transport system permease subunit